MFVTVPLLLWPQARTNSNDKVQVNHLVARHATLQSELERAMTQANHQIENIRSLQIQLEELRIQLINTLQRLKEAESSSPPGKTM